MSRDLEAVYRRALRWYPKRWRLHNEDAVVGTLLDQADENRRTAPARGELANLRASALSTRFGIVGRTIPASVRSRASVLALGLGTAIAVAGIVFGGIQWQVFDGDHLRQVFTVATIISGLGGGSFSYLLWLVAFISSLIGLRRTTMAILAASIPLSFAWPHPVMIALHLVSSPSRETLGFLDLLAIVALLGSPMLPRRGRLAIVASAAAFGAALIGSFELREKGGGYWGAGAQGIDYFWAPIAVWLIYLGIPLALGLAIVLWRRRRSPWAGAMLIASLPVGILSFFAFASDNDAIMTSVSVIVLAVIALGAIFGILRLFGLRLAITRR